MLKKIMAKKTAKKISKFAAKREGQIILGTLATMAGHLALQKAARKYPNFLPFKLMGQG